jgi:hypothetical protein
MANWLSKQVAAIKFQRVRVQCSRFLETEMRAQDRFMAKMEKEKGAGNLDEKSSLEFKEEFWTKTNSRGQSRQSRLKSYQNKMNEFLHQTGDFPENTGASKFGTFVGKLLSGGFSQRVTNTIEKFIGGKDEYDNNKYGWEVSNQLSLRSIEKGIQNEATQKAKKMNEMNEENKKFVSKIDVSDKFENKQPSQRNSQKLDNNNEPEKKRDSKSF